MPGSGTARFVLDGGDELARKLSKLSGKVEIKLLARAARAAAKPIVKAARAKAPRESGLLVESLGTFVKRYKRSKTAVAIVGPRRNFRVRKRAQITGASKGREPANYAHLVEGGTRPHFQPHAIIGGIVFTAFHHPGIPRGKFEFLKPAFDEHKSQAFGVMKRELSKGIAKEAAKKL